MTDVSARQVIFEEGAGVRGLNIYVDGGNLYVGGWNTRSSESNWQGTWLSTGINPDTWYHVVAWLDGGSTITPDVIKGYLNGVEFGSGDGSQLWSHGGDIRIGRNGGSRFHDGTGASAGDWTSGLIDEVQVSNIPRGTEWISTCYNNQNDPGSFNSVAVEESQYVLSGTIASQVLDTGADGARESELSWSETLQSGTDITFEVRASDTPFAKEDASPSWVSIGGTSPVTAGLPSGHYMQWRATLVTSDPFNTPTLHEVILIYY